MVIEILFNEVCSLFGDGQNVSYLQSTLPEVEFIFTPLTQRPYFADNTPDMIYIGSMSENTQRKVIAALMPLKERIQSLVDAGVIILATGNAGEIFTSSISYMTENIETEGLGIFDLTVKTDLFDRCNGKLLGEFEGMQIVGFRSQFSQIYGNNENCYFAKCIRGFGINRESNLEGMRKNNLICTQVLGPILPLNPLFCEYLLRLAGSDARAAYYDAAMAAYNQRVAEFSDPNVVFGHNK